MLRANLKWKLVSQLLGTCLALSIAIGITSCEQSILHGRDSTNESTADLTAINSSSALATMDGALSEVNIPAAISRLAPSLEKYQPQVRIISPKPDETFSDDRVTVKLDVRDLPLFKQPEIGLGNHLHVILDRQTYQGVYDLSQPLVFKNLAAGTHSLRVFASRPWHESFKNEGAYAQVSFNVLTKTAENNPDPQQPLLTYSRPAGTYGAEPIMLDYYLTNAPSHLVANGSQDSVPDWRIRATVNEQQFILDKWAPIYLQGFKQGKNWVRLELVDDRGNPLPNVYNDSVSIITYDPQTKDSLAKLVRGELDPNLARTLVDPTYVAIKPAPIPTPSAAPIPTIAPTPAPIPVPIVPNPSVIAPDSIGQAMPTPIVEPIPTLIPEPVKPISQPEGYTNESMVAPPVAPAPISTPIISNPPPAIPLAKPVPTEIPAPEVARNPIVPTPQPVPVITPQPAPIIAPVPTVIPEVAAPAVVTSSRSPQPQPRESEQPVAPTKPIDRILSQRGYTNEPPPTPTPVATSAAPTTEKTWQTQALDLAHIAGVKIRAFTNTIPGKAQIFGHNVQILAGKAIDQIQAWRSAHVD